MTAGRLTHGPRNLLARNTLLAVMLVLVLIAAAGCASASASTTVAGQQVSCGGAVVADWTPEQVGNAQAIAQVAIGLGLGQQGALVGITTAITESTLIAVNFGDLNSRGVMTTSRGLFQQMDPWGPLADRLDPTKSATMFYTGGQGGQDGLMDIPGWQQMTVPAAAQAVEKSQFSDGSNYAVNVAAGTALTEAVTATCTAAAPAANVAVNGVSVTIPNDPNVAEAVRGKVIQAPSQGMAQGLAAGFGALGLPYVWGGGGDGAPANDGCSRGGGQLNSCQGLTGFDCSGLTAYVYVKGGYPSPGGNSGAQRTARQSVAFNQGLPGDIVGFEGHVAIYLGVIDGTRYILEASTVGVPVHVVPLTRTDHDPQLHRHWSPT